MKLILLCLAVVLCTFGKDGRAHLFGNQRKGAAGIKFGGRVGFGANANVESTVGVSPKIKTADGDKHDNVPAGGKATLGSRNNLGAGAAIDLNSKMGLESDVETMVSTLAKASQERNPFHTLLEKLFGGVMASAGGSGDANAESKQQSSLGVSTASGSDQKFQAETLEADTSNMSKDLEAIVNHHRDNADTSGDSNADNKQQSSLGVSTASGSDQKLNVGMHNGSGMKALMESLSMEVGRELQASDSDVSGSQHSSVGATTDSEGHLNPKDEKAPEFNGNEVNGQNSSDSSGTGSMNVENKNDPDNHSLSSVSTSTDVASPGPHDSAGSGVSGRCTCPTDG